MVFLYGPTITIVILSFQGPDGGLTFPMRGVSLHWFVNLFQTQMVGDFGGSLERSLVLAMIVMVLTVGDLACWPASRSGAASRGDRAVLSDRSPA